MTEAVSSAAIFRRLARNNRWSNDRLHRACAALPDEEYHATRPCFFGTIHATLDHIVMVDGRYLDRLDGKPVPPSFPEGEHYADLPSMSAAQAASDRRLIALVDALDDAGLARRVSWISPYGESTVDPVASILLHLSQHQIHHRGQVHDLLAQTAVAPPQLDEFFLACDAERLAGELGALGLSQAPLLPGAGD